MIYSHENDKYSDSLPTELTKFFDSFTWVTFNRELFNVHLFKEIFIGNKETPTHN